MTPPHLRLLYIILSVAFVASLGCGTPDENCGNELDVFCEDGDISACVCNLGPHDGEACRVETEDPDDPELCENLCLRCDAPEPAGPTSILLGDEK